MLNAEGLLPRVNPTPVWGTPALSAHHAPLQLDDVSVVPSLTSTAAPSVWGTPALYAQSTPPIDATFLGAMAEDVNAESTGRARGEGALDGEGGIGMGAALFKQYAQVLSPAELPFLRRASSCDRIVTHAQSAGLALP